jgi:hypothetical protein
VSSCATTVHYNITALRIIKLVKGSEQKPGTVEENFEVN